MMMKMRRKAGSLLSVAVLAGVLSAAPRGAFAGAPDCGESGSSTVCVTLPTSTLTGPATIGVTVTFPSGRAPVIVTWVPNGRPGIYLMTKSKPSAELGGYSFVWPTQKYLDGSGVLRVQVGSTAAAPVDTPVTLLNGNATGFQHSPSDWQSYLPGAWSSSANPVVAAVGDAAADEVDPNHLAATIAATSPALFLYLGDIAEQGSFTENLNHYGVSALDNPAGATLFGAMASFTQPTLGNHEAGHVVDWTDYWHGRPEYTSFTFGGVKFLDLDSNISMKRGSPQYVFVQGQLATSPACVVGYWHAPALKKDRVSRARSMWKLLAGNGGDLVLNGHVHNMTQYVPLDANLSPAAGGMRQLISGAGGHTLANTYVDAGGRIEWSLGKTTGFLALTLVGARNGGTAYAISWEFRDINGNRIGAPGSFGSATC